MPKNGRARDARVAWLRAQIDQGVYHVDCLALARQMLYRSPQFFLT